MSLNKNFVDINIGEVIIREINLDDSIHDLTELLHKSYKRLSLMGLNFVATYQDDEITKDRIKDAICLVALINKKIIGTVSLYTKSNNNFCDWYSKDDVWYFGQFAVDPEFQNFGLGTILMQIIEEYTIQNNVMNLSLDTSEKAIHLINFYNNKGYNIVEKIQWESTNYLSVIMNKKLL